VLMMRVCGCDGSLNALRKRLGRRGVAERREQKVDGGIGGIDDPVEVTPTAPDSNIGLIDPLGFVGRLKMTAQSLFQFRTVRLHPMPDGRVIHRQTALGGQLFDVPSESECRRYQPTAHRINSAAVCRHLMIAGRVAFFTIV
jgi:hypothetical protein